MRMLLQDWSKVSGRVSALSAGSTRICINRSRVVNRIAYLTRITALLTLAASAILLFPVTAMAEEFYLRAGVGLDRPEETRFTDKDCMSLAPAALYGCGRGGDGAPLRSSGDFETVTGFELGFGYTITPAVRLEVLLEHRPSFAFDGQANFLDPSRRQSVSADLSTRSGMLAAYFDLTELGVPKLGPFSPFIGAGLGAARVKIDETSMTFPRTTTLVPGASHTNLAWMLTAGLGLSLAESMTLDLAWRYTDYGDIETAGAGGRIVWRDGSREPLALDLAPTQAKLRSHGLRLSLRYAF